MMIKKVLFLVGCCLWWMGLQAQMTNEGYPVSWGLKTLPSAVASHQMPTFDLQQIQQEDAINDQAWDRPWRFGYSHTVAFNLQNSGTWHTLPNGDRLWQIRFRSKDALTMNVVFDDFYLPEGATIYLYNPQTKEVRGAYTARNNNPERLLGSTILDGDDLVIEYFEPANVQGQGALQIGQVVHGYRTMQQFPTLRMKGLNDSGNCNHDVDCPVGVGWRQQINSVALLVANGNGFCVGALINNTRNDGTPYFLGANHCGTNNVGSWVFRFNWESTTPVCASPANSQAPVGPRNEVNGAVLRANSAGTDFSLLELNARPTGNIYYAGWDRRSITPTGGVGIHHPSGDLKKMCLDNDPLTPSSFGGASTWEVGEWEIGVTEGGSSGSPLFNQNKLIIGQLYGGFAACAGTVDNNREDHYGRLDISWNGSSASTRLRDWLDPTGSNTLVLQGYDPSGPGVSLDVGVSSVLGIEEDYCSQNTITPEVEIFNYGNVTVTSLELLYNVDGGPFTTYNWTGSLSPGRSTRVNLPSFTVGNGAHNFGAQTQLPNNMVDSNTTNDAGGASFFVTLQGTPISYFLELDCYGDETTWELTDSAETTVLAQGGPYPRNFNTIDTIFQNLCLPGGCYRLALFDNFGDGLDGTNGFCGRAGSYGITNASNGGPLVTMTASNGNFGRRVEHFFCVSGSINVQQRPSPHGLTLFPNPTTGLLQVDLDLARFEAVQLRLYDVTGQQVWQGTPIETTSTTLTVDLSDYPTGVYVLQAQIGNTLYTQKVVRY